MSGEYAPRENWARSKGMKKIVHPIPAADLTDEVWTVDHIAAYLRMRPSAAYARAREDGFPEPFIGNCRHRRWHAADVRAHFAGPVARSGNERRGTPHRAAAAGHPGRATFKARKAVSA